LRGIELPYRTTWEHGRRANGFAAAVERAVASVRPDAAIVISDLAGFGEDEARAIRAIARLRRASGGVIAIVPAPTAFLPTAAAPHDKRAREIVIRDLRSASDAGRRLLSRHGVTVIEGSPGVPLDQLLHGRPTRAAG
jgi:hypothetical protein